MKDYIILKDYEIETGWQEIFLFSHKLTDEEIKKIHNAVQEAKDTNPLDYDNNDIEDAIKNIVPYTKSFIISNDNDYHVIYY